jgi:cytochrome P450
MSNTAPSTEIYWDPFDEELDSFPHDTWRRMRDDAPLYRNDRFDFWALTRFDDVQAAHLKPNTYLSSRGTVLEFMGFEYDQPGSIIFMDQPQHTILRSLVSRAFTPRRMGALEDGIRQVCGEYLDRLAGAGGFDYVQDFAVHIPSTIISMLIGVPEADREMVRHWIDQVFHIEPGVGMANDISMTAGINVFQYMEEQAEERRKRPQDDLLTVIVEAEVKDDEGNVRRLSTAEVAGFANLLTSAGTETVARLLGNAAVILGAHPEQRAEMVADPALVQNAIEELLRYEAPSPVQGRWVAEDVEWHGEVVPANSKVLLVTGSAGRDERKYPNADQFDIHRHFDSQVSFGFGIHFCIGAALARLEGRLALEETFKRVPNWVVDEANVVRQHTSTVRGYHHVPITF